MTEPEIRAEIRRHVDAIGSMRSAARQWGVSVSYVSDCLNGRRAPGPAVLGPIGYRRVVRVVYEKAPPPQEPTPCPKSSTPTSATR